MLKFGYYDNAVVDVFSDQKEPKYNPNSESAKLAGEQFKKTVTAAKNVIKRSGDFLYVRTRAIGSLEKWGPNMNGDGFPMKELAKSYRTFVGKGNFIDHKSDDITKIRGLVIDAFLNNDDNCVECLIAVDKKSHPQLARDIETGTVNSVSMGTRVGWSLCSVCQNKARTEKDYCTHISNYKGMKIGFLTQNTAHRNGQWPVHEVNHELEFIELSWVAVPAFTDAYVLEKIASVQRAVGNGFTTELSDSEQEILAFASIKNETSGDDMVTNIPESLKSIAEGASCQNDECSFDARKKAVLENNTKTASEMRRITIVNEETKYRRLPKDWGAKGKVTIDGKEYEWWAASADKTDWLVSMEESLADLISAKGQKQISDAVSQLISKNIDSSELIVAGSDFKFVKESWAQNFSEDPAMSGDGRVEEVISSDKKREKGIYNNKDLEVPQGGDGRDEEQKSFEETAKDGPSGAIGKNLAEKDKTINHKELELKQQLRRAYLSYLSRNGKNKN